MRLGELQRTTTVDPIVVGGQTVGEEVSIVGQAPGTWLKSWWPWIIAGGALAFAWWISEQREGRKDRPLAPG